MMAVKKMDNDRCPLQSLCERKCEFVFTENECDFFKANLTPEFEDDARRAGIYLPMVEESIDWDSVPDDDFEDDLSVLNADIVSSQSEESDSSLFPCVSVSDFGGSYLNGENGYTAKINDALNRAKSEFLYIGMLLLEVDAYGYYSEAGFSDVYEYCEVTFGFKRSSTNNFMRVYRKFGEAMGLQDRYKGYSYSQLTEMCSMNDYQLQQCSKEMSVMKLRELKRGIRDSVIDVSPKTIQTSGCELHDSHHSYQIPSWLVSKMSYLFGGFSRDKLFDALDAGLVSIYGCELGYFNPYVRELND